MNAVKKRTIFGLVLLLMRSLGTCKELYLDNSENSAILLHILEQFHNFDLIFHFNNITTSRLDQLFQPIRDPNGHKAMRLINYDQMELVKRPLGMNYIHVVYLKNPMDFVIFSGIDYNLRPHDIVLMVVTSLGRNVTKIWNLKGIEQAGGLFLVDLSRSSIFTCCFFCGNNTGVLKKISSRFSKSTKLVKYLNTYEDFNGHLFQIAHSHFPPFFSCRYENGRCIPKGSEGELFKTMSKLLNFRYNLIKYNHSETQGDWEAMVEAVHYKKVDWAVGGISATLGRGNITDFTRFIKNQGYTVLYCIQYDAWINVENVVLVFQWPIMVCLVIFVISIGVISKLSLHMTLVMDVKTSAASFMGLALRSLVEQSSSNLKENHKWRSSTRLLFLVWWMLSLCFTTYYRSQMASYLIKPRNREPDNIEQLVEKQYLFQANNQDWSVLEDNFLESSVEAYKDVLKRIDDNLGFCESVFYALDHKVGVIDEETPMQYEVYKHCSKSMTSFEKSKIRLVNQNLFPGGYHAWCMTEGTPFRLKISKTIGRMDDSGLIDHWYDSAFALKLTRSNEITIPNEFAALNVLNIVPPLVVLGIGLSAALTVFVIELCTVFRKK